MKRLWASWRMKYISGNTPQTIGCVFCEALKFSDSADNLIVERGKHCFVILNKFPYTSGHVMVAPLAHTAELGKVNYETGAEAMAMITRYTEILKRVYRPEGFNIGANIGAAAGAGVPGHLHFHIVPRWNGDTNYMTTVGEVRVLPEDLTETYQRIKKVVLES